MAAFTTLELAVLRAIFRETPQPAPGLERQLEAAVVIERENSGCGFFTTIAVGDDAPALPSPSVLGHATHARVTRLEHDLGFVPFINDGKLDMLEGFAWGPDDTAGLDLATVEFELYH